MKSITFLSDLINSLAQQDTTLLPCSEQEIEEVAQGRELPAAFLEFLTCLGRGTGGEERFMVGEDCYYDRLPYLTADAQSLLQENRSSWRLADNDFVFFMSQGCFFCFFKTDEGDNPPVYFYAEAGEDRYYKIARHYTDFLMGYLEQNPDLFTEIS